MAKGRKPPQISKAARGLNWGHGGAKKSSRMTKASSRTLTAGAKGGSGQRRDRRGRFA